MKKIALFGASGRTGMAFLETALEHGYAIRALARDPKKITIAHDNLEVVKGDVLLPSDVHSTIKGTDMVVSLFGHVKDSPAGLQTNGTKNIVTTMKEEGLRKIISLSGGGLPFPEKDEPKFADKLIRFIMKVAVPKVLNDAIAHHAVLEKSSLDWIIVRGPRLTMDPPKGAYRVSWVGVNSGTQISRADLAAFILTQVEDDTFLRKMPFVSW